MYLNKNEKILIENENADHIFSTLKVTPVEATKNVQLSAIEKCALKEGKLLSLVNNTLLNNMEKKRAEHGDKEILSNCAKQENQVTKDCDININEKLYKIFLEHTKMENKNIVRDLLETYKSHTTQQLYEGIVPKRLMKKCLLKKFPNLLGYIHMSFKNEDLMFTILKGLTEEIESKVPTKVLKTISTRQFYGNSKKLEKSRLKKITKRIRSDCKLFEKQLAKESGDYYVQEKLFIFHFETYINTIMNGVFGAYPASFQDGNESKIAILNKLISTKITTSKRRNNAMKILNCCFERLTVILEVRNMLEDLKEKLKDTFKGSKSYAQSAQTLDQIPIEVTDDTIVASDNEIKSPNEMKVKQMSFPNLVAFVEKSTEKGNYTNSILAEIREEMVRCTDLKTQTENVGKQLNETEGSHQVVHLSKIPKCELLEKVMATASEHVKKQIFESHFRKCLTKEEFVDQSEKENLAVVENQLPIPLVPLKTPLLHPPLLTLALGANHSETMLFKKVQFDSYDSKIESNRNQNSLQQQKQEQRNASLDIDDDDEVPNDQVVQVPFKSILRAPRGIKSSGPGFIKKVHFNINASKVFIFN